MGVHVREPDRPARCAARPQQRSEHDAAIAAKDNGESSALGRGGHAFGQHAGIGDHLLFVASLARWPREIAIAWRHGVAEVVSAEPPDEPAIAEHAGRAIEVALLPVVVRPNPDARWRADDCDVTSHWRPHGHRPRTARCWRGTGRAARAAAAARCWR